MKKIFLLFIISLFSLNIKANAEILDSASELKKDLTKKFFEKEIKKPVRIAVIKFNNLDESSKKANAGEVFSSALIQEFIKDKDFVVIERNKLEDIFKELRLNLSGAVDEKEIKRAGLILGVDWLVLGDISISEGNFLIQSRIVNSETALVAAASSISIEKNILLKEADDFVAYTSKNYFSLSLGNFNISDLNFNSFSISAELRHNFTKTKYGSVRIQSSVGENAKIYKNESFTNIYPPAFLSGLTIYPKEKFKSLSLVAIDFGIIKNFFFSSKIKFELGPTLYILKSKQEFGVTTGSISATDPVTGLLICNLPYSTEQTYTFPAIEAGINIEKNIWKSLILGFDFKYSAFKFKRKLDAGSENTMIKNDVDKLNKDINSNSVFIGTKISFAF